MDNNTTYKSNKIGILTCLARLLKPYIRKDLRYKRKLEKAKQKAELRKITYEIAELNSSYKKKIKYSKFVVLLSIVAVLCYTTATFLLQYFTSYEISATLTTCFYSFFGVELLTMCGIKMNDTKYDVVYEQQNNNTINTLRNTDEEAVG